MSRSYTIRFVLISLIFIGIQVAVLAFGVASMRAVNATRAYAMGESLYSKGQKEAVLDLYRYAQTGRQEFLDDF